MLAVVDQDAPDRGTNGSAMLSRPHEMREVGAEWRGSVRKGAVVEVRAYRDAALYDVLRDKGLIGEREHAVAERLAGLFHAAGLDQPEIAHYAPREVVGAPEEGNPALDEYRAALRPLTATEAHVVDSLLAGGWRGWMATTLDQALRRLAKEWGL